MSNKKLVYYWGCHVCIPDTNGQYAFHCPVIPGRLNLFGVDMSEPDKIHGSCPHCGGVVRLENEAKARKNLSRLSEWASRVLSLEKDYKKTENTVDDQ